MLNRTNYKAFLLSVLAAFAIVLLLMLAGSSDYTAEEADRQVYCDMVGKGFWPDYNGTFKAECDHKVRQADIR